MRRYQKLLVINSATEISEMVDSAHKEYMKMCSIRSQMMVSAMAQGMCVKEIAEAFNVSVQSVYKATEHFRSELV